MFRGFRSVSRVWAVCAALCWVLAACGASRAAPVIIENGQPRAEILIADHPPRMVTVAARELQTYLEKLSGAKLAIVNSPTAAVHTRIYVGKSPQTDALGISVAGLPHGAFRIVSGPDWLALVGNDFDFVGQGPIPTRRDDIPTSQDEWDRITGHTWLNPANAVFKWYHRQAVFSHADEGGSLDAVYEFLRRQGVRWYMPGELGEIVPKVATIRAPAGDQTVHPNFAVRYLHWSCYNCATWENIIKSRSIQTAKSSTPITSSASIRVGNPWR